MRFINVRLLKTLTSLAKKYKTFSQFEINNHFKNEIKAIRYIIKKIYLYILRLVINITILLVVCSKFLDNINNFEKISVFSMDIFL